MILGVGSAEIIIWHAKNHASHTKDSLLNYRQADPIDEKEKQQNDEALRILEKKYIEKKISKDEYLKRKRNSRILNTI